MRIVVITLGFHSFPCTKILFVFILNKNALVASRRMINNSHLTKLLLTEGVVNLGQRLAILYHNEIHVRARWRNLFVNGKAPLSTIYQLFCY